MAASSAPERSWREAARHVGFVGEVIEPGAPDYETSRQVWNGMIDRRPSAVLQPIDAADVARAVGLARDHGALLAVRGGGHGLPGFGTCDDGLVIDLSRMHAISVDMKLRTARVGGGATWVEVDAATHPFGLATPGGLISTTGVGGLTLGGGMGWLVRPYGLSCDNVLAAEVVTAAGEIVRASAVENADLFWAIRGGGGNFGIVTEFELALHPVTSVLAGLVLFPLERAIEVGRNYRRWIEGLSDACTSMLIFLTAPDEEFVPAGLRSSPAVAIAACHVGQSAQATAELALIRGMAPAADLFETVPYPAFQQAFDADSPGGRRYYFKGGFATGLPDEIVEAIAGWMRRRPSPRNELDIHHLGGAVGRVGEDATAFSDRRSPFTYNVISSWDDPSDDDANRDWARGLSAELDRFGSGRAYVNFATDPAASGSVEAAYGSERHDRLVAAKRRWDPGNLFRLNQNVKP
jgi:FAD binding domain/Berberine and berberine like